MKKRSQVERLTIVESVLDEIWKEYTEGNIDEDGLQIAVYCQTFINRIVWKLNHTIFKSDILYPCDPDKNTECKKTSCFINGGPCNSTVDERFKNEIHT